MHIYTICSSQYLYGQLFGPSGIDASNRQLPPDAPKVKQQQSDEQSAASELCKGHSGKTTHTDTAA